ncbi:homeodomain-only protein [Oryzias melastigma]|uniref:Homeodomain-only protein n=1 Tax=Oryzias melastigma TaxID=30732 RepID=A0A3B3CMQ7_ORYME|nr:homeodomain-only protein [Oryzias melastigma]
MALSRTDEDYMAGLDRQQIQQLENNFMKFTKNPDELQLILIAGECGTTVEEAKKWFKGRNAAWRESEGLPAQTGSVLD